LNLWSSGLIEWLPAFVMIVNRSWIESSEHLLVGMCLMMGVFYIPKLKNWWEKSWKGAEMMVHFCNVTKISLRMFFEGQYFGEMVQSVPLNKHLHSSKLKCTICTHPYFGRNFLLEPQRQPSVERCTKIGYCP
jgi:hypothetical protein